VRLILVSLAYLILFSSCEWLSSLNDEREPVARVKEQFLYMEDVLAVMPELTSKEDSADFVRNFSEKWVEEQVMIDRASINLNKGMTDIENKVKTYRNSLLIYAYEEALVRQKLDTVLTALQIKGYYNDHKEDFILRDDVYRMLFLKLDKNTPRLAELRQWFDYADRQEKLSLLTDYSIQFALDYSLDDKKWWRSNEMMQRLPFKVDSLVSLNANNKLLEIQKDEFLYVLEFLDMKSKNNPSPLGLVKPAIRTIMLNERKIQLVKELRKDLMSDGIRKNHIEYFSKE